MTSRAPRKSKRRNGSRKGSESPSPAKPSASSKQMASPKQAASSKQPSSSKSKDKTSPRERKRVPVACFRCRRRKIRCSGETEEGGLCNNCAQAGNVECIFLRANSIMINRPCKASVIVPQLSVNALTGVYPTTFTSQDSTFEFNSPVKDDAIPYDSQEQNLLFAQNFYGPQVGPLNPAEPFYNHASEHMNSAPPAQFTPVMDQYYDMNGAALPQPWNGQHGNGQEHQAQPYDHSIHLSDDCDSQSPYQGIDSRFDPSQPLNINNQATYNSTQATYSNGEASFDNIQARYGTGQVRYPLFNHEQEHYVDGQSTDVSMEMEDSSFGDETPTYDFNPEYDNNNS